MFNLIFGKWPVKLLCLVLATGLWVYVAIGASMVDKLPSKITLTMRNVQSGMVATTNIDSVEIKVSTDRSMLSNLSAESFNAYVDLTGKKKGAYEVDVVVTTNLANVEIVDISPKKVLVYIEPMVTKKVPVKVQTEGEAGEGLIPGDAALEPAEVEISGAEGIISKILEASVLIQLNGETENINKTVIPVALDAQGEKIKGVEFNPKDIKVTLPIVKAGSTKTTGIKVKLIGNPKAGYWVSQIVTTPSDVVIRGQSGILRSINFIETKTIDIEGLSNNATKLVDLDLPSGVSIADANDKIKVEIKFSQNNSEKEITAGIIYDNLSSTLKVDSVEPSIVKAIVSAPFEILSTLTSSNVQIHLDLSSYRVPGNYSLDIDRNTISVPIGASVTSFVPSAVRVNISSK